MSKFLIRNVFKEKGFYWIRVGGGMKRFFIEDLYKLLSEKDYVGCIVSNEVKNDLEKYVLKNELKNIF
jgi:hypothetical protein